MKSRIPIFISIAAIIIIAILFIPNTSKALRNLFKKDLQSKELLYKKKYDSIQSIREKETAIYQDELDSINQELEIISNKLEIQQQKSKQYEKELATYRRGNFDERFRAFANLVTKDSLQ